MSYLAGVMPEKSVLVRCLPNKQTYGDYGLKSDKSEPWLVDEGTASHLEANGLVERVHEAKAVHIMEDKALHVAANKRRRRRKA